MRRELNDQDVVNLLKGLKQAEKNYPSELMDSRRSVFAKQVAAVLIALGTGAGSGAPPTGNGGGTGAGTGTASNVGSSIATGMGSSVGTILEAALVVAIVVEAGVATYIYRDKIADFINSHLSPKTELVTNPPDNLNLPVTGDEVPTEISPTITETATATPSPNVIVLSATPVPQGNDATNPPSSGSTQVNSTPAPDDGNPGLHLGQTKQPTKEPQNNPNSENDTNKSKNKK